MQLHGGIDEQVWQQHAWRNRIHSLQLLLTMGGFLALLGWLIWGWEGIFILLGAGTISVLLTPRISPHWVMRLYRASPITPQRFPQLHAITRELALRAGLPNQPQLYYLPTKVINAFALGTKEQSTIALSDALLRRLDLRELAGVLAHEMSHITSNDLKVMNLADILSRGTNLISILGQAILVMTLPLFFLTDMSINLFAILLMIFAPHISTLAQLALSRTREFDADLNAARLTGDPEGLAHALVKIERVQGGWIERMLIPGRGVPEPSLLRTHPQTKDRVDKLLALKPAMDQLEPLFTDNLVNIDTALGEPVMRVPRWHINGLWH